MPTQHHLLIDTDPGIDDAMALLFLRAHPQVRIVGITSVFGNATIEVTTRNACYLAERFDIDAPVFAGAADPIRSERPPSLVHVHGANGLGDAGSIGTKLLPVAGPAHEHIARMVRAAPQQITILTLGPLTNLALALRHDPGIADLVARVVVMGGAFGLGRRRGNVSPVAEANVRNDPHAADEVLAASWPITVVGLDVTMNCVFTPADASALAADAGEAGQFLRDISRDYELMYERVDGIQGCFLHDVTAAVHVVAPELFTTSSGPIRVVTEGIAIGQTIQRPSGMVFPAGAWDGIPEQKACTQVDAAALIRTYAGTLVKHANRDKSHW